MALQTTTTFLIGFLELIAVENELSGQVVEIIKNARNDWSFHTVLYMSHEAKGECDCKTPFNEAVISKLIAERLELPIIHLRGRVTFYLWPWYNRRIFAIVPLSGNGAKDKQLLLSMWKTLRRNVKSRLLLLAKRENDIDYLKEIEKFCIENKAINVVAVMENFVETKNYYSSTLYPEYKLNKHFLEKNGNQLLYPNQVQNINRSPLRLAMQSISNKAYILHKNANNIVLGGYVGHFFTEFSRKHNATLTFPNYGKVMDDMFTISFDKVVENGTYDISTYPTIDFFTNDMVYSEIYEYMDWCFMVPLEKPLPAYLFYAVICDSFTMVLMLISFVIFSWVIEFSYWIRRQHIVLRNLVLNIYIINGLLGQSYPMETSFVGIRSFLYVLICVAGLIFNTSYVTYLQTYNTQPPMEKAIKTLNDVKESGMKIAIYQDEFDFIDSYGVADDIKPLSKFIDTYLEYTKLRDSYDTRYVYPVPSSQWSVYEQHQKFFKKPLFRLSDICVVNMAALRIPLQENSIYEEAINRMIRQSNEAGLIQHWRAMSFLEAVRRKQIYLMSGSNVSAFVPMKLGDLNFLFYVFVVLMCLIMFCFIMELYWPRRGIFIGKVLHKV